MNIYSSPLVRHAYSAAYARGNIKLKFQKIRHCDQRRLRRASATLAILKARIHEVRKRLKGIKQSIKRRDQQEADAYARRASPKYRPLSMHPKAVQSRRLRARPPKVIARLVHQREMRKESA